MDIVFENIDFTRPETCSLLFRLIKQYSNLPTPTLQTISQITIDVAEELAKEVQTTPSQADNANATVWGGTTTRSPVPVPTLAPCFAGKCREFLTTMVEQIAHNGHTTLAQAAADHGVSVETARAFLRNAGRSAQSHGVTLPFYPRWDSLKSYNTYHFR